ncbi:preprotein translocase subunit SecD, partial [Halonatronum saccharophilum]
MDWKKKRMTKLFSVLILLGVAVFFLYPLDESINLGLDLQGGTQVVLEARDTDAVQVDDDAVRRAMSVIQTRVDEMGLAEPIVQRQGERRIMVSLPGVEDPNQAVQTIGQTAQLQFKDEDGNIVMTGEALSDARGAYGGDVVQRPVIQFELTREGSRQFGQITRENIGRRISIYLDDELLTSPTVQSE